jgi:hypothetical protein
MSYWAESIISSNYNSIDTQIVKNCMSTIEQIETAILTLAPDEFQWLRQWFADVDYQRWDQQLEQDIADGKLDALAAEAIAEFNDSQRSWEQILQSGAIYEVWSLFDSHEAAHKLAQLLESE